MFSVAQNLATPNGTVSFQSVSISVQNFRPSHLPLLQHSFMFRPTYRIIIIRLSNENYFERGSCKYKVFTWFVWDFIRYERLSGSITHRATYVYKPTRWPNFVIRLYFRLDALHVSDCISPSSGATFISCTSHLVYAGTIRLAVVWV